MAPSQPAWWGDRKLAVPRADARPQRRSRGPGGCFRKGRCSEDLPSLGELVSVRPVIAQQVRPALPCLPCWAWAEQRIGGRWQT